MLSRMQTDREAKRILTAIQQGEIDIVIGTHRLLSEDVVWKRLGLLIVDEEHRFGVLHKEKIKKLRAGIDILSLSATPIPRSLNLALSGLRHISVLSTPPKAKKPIETIITPWNDRILYDAIKREYERGGQIIVIHNRIHGLDRIAEEIGRIMDDMNLCIVTTHGRMTGEEIDIKIHAFRERKYDILLTTTIIENGVNFLSANTIIILDPEDF